MADTEVPNMGARQTRNFLTLKFATQDHQDHVQLADEPWNEHRLMSVGFVDTALDDA